MKSILKLSIHKGDPENSFCVNNTLNVIIKHNNLRRTSSNTNLFLIPSLMLCSQFLSANSNELGIRLKAFLNFGIL